MATVEYERLCRAHHLAAHAFFIWRRGGVIGNRGIYLTTQGGGIDSPTAAGLKHSAAYLDPAPYVGFWKDCLDYKLPELLAGSLAQKRLRQFRNPPGRWFSFFCGDDDDDDQAAKAVLQAVCGQGDITFVLALESNKPRHILRHPRVWAAVEALAFALIEASGHLTGEAAFQLIEAHEPPRRRPTRYERIGDASRRRRR